MKFILHPSAFILCSALVAGAALAQPFPAKPVRIVVPWPAGGPPDQVGRLLGQRLSEVWKQQVIVDNRPTVLAPEIVAKSPADGYTVLLNGSAHWIGPFVSKVSYDPVADFAPLTLVFPPMLVVSVALAVIISAFITFDGESNWIEGAALIAVYAIIAAAFWWDRRYALGKAPASASAWQRGKGASKLPPSSKAQALQAPLHWYFHTQSPQIPERSSPAR